MNKDNLSGVFTVAKIMDILNKSGEDIPKNVFSFLTESLLKALKKPSLSHLNTII